MGEIMTREQQHERDNERRYGELLYSHICYQAERTYEREQERHYESIRVRPLPDPDNVPSAGPKGPRH